MKAGVKLLLILSYKVIERLATMVMAAGILFSMPVPEPTYSPSFASVNTIAYVAPVTEIPMVDNPTNTAGTTKVSVGLKPRLVALPGESQEVIDAIISHFPNEPVMVEVARCESSLDPAADRKGIDGGLFQINQVHLPRLNELGLDRYDLYDNLRYSYLLYKESGLQPWYMSEHCWGKYV